MARQAAKGSTAQLPQGFKKVTALTWDFEEMPLLQGVIVAFGDVPKKDFHDGQYVPGSRQKYARVRAEDGRVFIVYESGGLLPLFDLGVGEMVAIAYVGLKRLPGREKPMKEFDVGVMS